MKRPTLVGLAGLTVMVAAIGVGGVWTGSQSQEVGGAASREPDPRAAVFVRLGCNECHAISGLGVEALMDVGPDLTFAYADVQIRFGFSLGYFLANPRGLMGLVVPTHIEIAPVQRDSMIQILKRLYEERRAEMDTEIPSNPLGRFPRPRPASQEP